MVEVLKQPPYSPIPIEKQVVQIYAGTKGFLDDIPVSAVTKFEEELTTFMDSKYPQILEQIREKKQLDKDLEEELNRAIEDFKSQFVA